MSDKTATEFVSEAKWAFAENIPDDKFIWVDRKEGKEIFNAFMNEWIDRIILSIR